MTLLLAFVINRNYKKVNIASGTEEIKFQMSRGTCFVFFFLHDSFPMRSNSGIKAQNNRRRFVCLELFGFYFEEFS